jgi:hypothetical protein
MVCLIDRRKLLLFAHCIAISCPVVDNIWVGKALFYLLVPMMYLPKLL